MTAGLTLSPALVVDPIDYLLVDIATGRHLPGDAVHAEQLAHEHGLDVETARDALEAAWHLGLVTRGPGGTSGVVVWTPEITQQQIHRLARAMVTAVQGICRGPIERHGLAERHSVIDGEAARMGVIEMFGLATPCDVDLFLELARALLGGQAPTLVDELVVPIGVLMSEAAQVVHGIELAAPAAVRDELVGDLVRCLMDGDADGFTEALADYVVAVSID